jgi:NAD(P)H-dependent flavin oxidoreductase YrpB (nitropropane dioxygenase family)
MKLNPLTIGNITVPIPIIQGGMAVRISTAPLAAAVANEGGIGVIAGTGMEPEELRAEIRKARELSPGIIGVNILFAVSQFAELVKAAIMERIDLVISGAGISRDMYVWGKEADIPIVPVVSSARYAKMAEKMGAAAVVVEGTEAGGHLGTDLPLFDILPEVIETVNIPVVAAGGIVDGYDIKRALEMGADGVQMGTRFAASVESNASKEFKDLYVRARAEDVTLIDSPVGLPGRGIISDFTRSIEGDLTRHIDTCYSCLKRCSHKFCILDALRHASFGGDYDQALVFSGTGVGKINEILPVKEIFKRLLEQLRE